MKRMLFNATHPEELRVAIVDGQKLLDLDIESAVRTQKKGNIYKGKVTRVEPSLEAAFVEYGAERQGFLPLKEISRAYFQNYSSATPMAQVRIKDVINEGQELTVQVEKDERGTKGAALTTFISLAGRFVVLMPNNPKGGGISRRISGDERSDLRDALNQLNLPSEHALIARTAGIGRNIEELQWDLDYLMQLWRAIENAVNERPAPFLVFQESNLVVRAIRDYLRTDIAEIIIDDEEIFNRATRFMEQVMPQNLSKLKLHNDSVPLFSRFQIESQIDSAFSREVHLSSGGSIAIDHTEALVTIDVNSARATKGADIEETALQTNLEAVDEIARQLRIRDLGGLVVLDLIDMTTPRNQRTVENRFNEALRTDRARVQVGRISRFGLLEMSRQRLRSSLGESNYRVCPHCDGTGQIRSVTSFSLNILRLIEEEALKENTEAIHAHLPVEIGTYLLNEKRHEVNMIENRLATKVYIIPTADLVSPNYKIRRLKTEDIDDVSDTPSYKIRLEQEKQDYRSPSNQLEPGETASVSHEMLDVSAPPLTKSHPPASKTKEEKGLWARLKESFFGAGESDQQSTSPATQETRTKTDHSRRSKQHRGKQGDSGLYRRRGGKNQAQRQDQRQTRGKNNANRDEQSNRSQQNNRGNWREQGNKNRNARNQSNRNNDNRNQKAGGNHNHDGGNQGNSSGHRNRRSRQSRGHSQAGTSQRQDQNRNHGSNRDSGPRAEKLKSQSSSSSSVSRNTETQEENLAATTQEKSVTESNVSSGHQYGGSNVQNAPAIPPPPPGKQAEYTSRTPSSDSDSNSVDGYS